MSYYVLRLAAMREIYENKEIYEIYEIYEFFIFFKIDKASWILFKLFKPKVSFFWTTTMRFEDCLNNNNKNFKS